MHPTGLAGDGLWLQVEPHLDSQAFSSPFGSSYLNSAIFNTSLMLRYHTSPEVLNSMLPKDVTCRINLFCASDALAGLNELIHTDPQVGPLLRTHLRKISDDFNTCMGPQQYLEQNEQLWERTLTLLRGACQPERRLDHFPYPFEPFWSELREAETGHPMSIRAKEAADSYNRRSQAAGFLSIDDVLLTARNVIGGSKLDADAPLMDAGLDSLGATELCTSLATAAGQGVDLPATLVFERPTVRQIACFIYEEESGSQMFEKASRAGKSELETASAATIAGSLQAAELHGDSTSAWRLCLCALNVVGEVPSSRWDEASEPMIASAALSEEAHHCVRYSAFMSGVEFFDNSHFSISRVEASAIDPQQRLLLERGYAAMHATGRCKRDLLGSSTSAFVGIDYNDFQHIVTTGSLRYSVHSATGSNLAVAAGRTSFVLGLHGPCVTVDTSCSSGLVATSLAQLALSPAQSDDAVVTSVFCTLLPAGHIVQARAGMLSVSGRCHTSDFRADGFAKGEACGAVILQRRASQVLRQDSGSLAGHAVRQDGGSASLTAPNGQAQEWVIDAALSTSAVTPDAIDCVEAHGTGTALGDPTEVGSLTHAVLRKRRASLSSKLALSSIKANMAHAEPAAGLMGLLKLRLQLSSVQVAPNAQLRLVNRHVVATLYGGLCALPLQTSASAGIDEVQTGGVSSFGYSGTIAHALLQGGKTSVQKCCSMSGLLYKRHVFEWKPQCESSERSSDSDGQPLFWFSTVWRPYAVQHGTEGTPRPWLALGPRADAVQGAPFDNLAAARTAADWEAVAFQPECQASAAPSISCVDFLRALIHHLLSVTAAPRLLVVTCGTQVPIHFAASPSVAGAAHGCTWGFMRVLRLEMISALWGASADVRADSKKGKVSVASLLSAWGSPESAEAEPELSCTGLAFHVQRLRAGLPVGVTISRHAALGTTAVVTGGLGGLGLHAALLFAQDGADALMLSSRSGAVACNEGLEAQLAVLQAQSSSTLVRLLACDVGYWTEVQVLLQITVSSSPRMLPAPHMRVLHGAGLLRDRLLRSTMATDVSLVFAPKAVAASLLHSGVAHTPLDSCLLFSSISAAFGNIGQVAYASASAHLDAIALSRSVSGSAASSLQLPPVVGVGMGASAIDAKRLAAGGAISLEKFGDCLLSIVLEIGPHMAFTGTHAPLSHFLLKGVKEEAPLLRSLSELEAGLGEQCADAHSTTSLLQCLTKQPVIGCKKHWRQPCYKPCAT